MEETARRLATTCFLLAGGMVGLVLLGWRLGQPRVGMLDMSASAVVLLFATSVAGWLCQRSADSVVANGLGMVIGIGALTASFFQYAQFLFPYRSPVEQWLNHAMATPGQFSLLRMSHTTAFGLLLVNAACLLQFRPWGRRWISRQASAILALASCLLGLVMLLCYLLQTTFYTQMAFVSAVDFLLLGLGLLLTAGFDAWPMNVFFLPATQTPSGRHLLWGWLSLALLLGVTVLATGWFYCGSQRFIASRAAQEMLATVADLKVTQIVDWRNERWADASYFRYTPYAGRRGISFLTYPNAPGSEKFFRSWAKCLLENKQWEQLVLLDEQLNVRLVQPEGYSLAMAEAERAAAQRAFNTKNVVEADLHRAAEGGAVYLSLAVPLVRRESVTNGIGTPDGGGSSQEERSKAVMILRVNANTSLFPVSQSWPTPSPTSETLLLRREGDEIVFLNNLRHRTNAPLTLRQPVDRVGLESRAILGLGKTGGRIQGEDYRGTEVLAIWRSVPKTPWVLIAKVDQSEILGPLRRQAWTTAGFVGGLIGAAMLGVGLLGRQRHLNAMRRELLLERQQREAEEKFRTLFESSRDAIMILDRSSYLDCNPAALELFGFDSKEEFLGKRPTELSPPRQPDGSDSRTGGLGHIERAYAEGSAFCEWHLQRRDGRLVPIEVQLSRVEIGGKVLVQAALRDITERKKAEEELRWRAALLDLPHDAIMVHDLKNLIVYWSRGAEKTYGWTQQQAVGRTKETLLKPLAPALERQIQNELLQRGLWEGELTHTTRDGRNIVVQSRQTLQKDEQGRPVGVLEVNRDITEKLTLEERFRQLAENIREVFWMTDTRKNQMLYISPGYEAIWGRTCASLYQSPRDWLAAVHPEDRERVRQSMLQNQVTGSYDEEYRIVRPDGTIRWIRDRAFPVRGQNGEVYRIAGIAEDVTDRKRAELALLEISDREQARIGQDLHDGLCQHLVAIAFAANSLEDTLARRHAPEAAEVREIATLLDDAITQARNTARGLYPVSLEDDGLASALRELAQNTNQRAALACVLEYPAPVLVRDNAAATQLYRIAQEAVNNALKHAQPKQILIRLVRHNGQIELSVLDDGVGIPESFRSNRGMGINIMQYRARTIGGALNIHRRQQGGTAVSCLVREKVTLPRAENRGNVS